MSTKSDSSLIDEFVDGFKGGVRLPFDILVSVVLAVATVVSDFIARSDGNHHT
jgi:hypothetical protein